MTDRHEQRMYTNDVLARAEERTAARLAASTTPADQPADLLAAAATALRGAANAAIHDGRTTWRLGSTRGSKSPVVLDDQDKPTVLIETWAPRLEDVNAYLTLVGPATGLAIAEWLSDAAAGDDHGEHDPYALAVARAVLGQNGSQQ